VPRAWVSPDGRRYAYPGVADGVVVQNITSATTSTIGAGKSWGLIDVEASGVYATPSNTAGLWLLPFAGTPKQITSSGYWVAASGNFAYGFSTSSPSTVANTILKLDLNTGSSSDWFTRPSGQSSVLGLDGKGNPVVEVNNSAGYFEVWLTVAPNSGYLLVNEFGANGGAFVPYGSPVGDSHGLWFSSNLGIALYVPSTGAWYWQSGVGNVQLAGSCS
jgi:hypothetical protein